MSMVHRRKLAAILSADVGGYSRLMGDDEQATRVTLTAYRDIFKQHITAHEGRLVDATGDALLAEFPSAIEAVTCAIDIQRELAGRNAALPEHRRMRFRIGVNLGDVTEQDGALYGDGVNIAARLEALAAAGGVCVSGTVYDHVEGKVAGTFTFAGEQAVKNIAKPVRAYHAHLEFAETPPVGVARARPRRFALLLVVVVLASVGVAVWLARRAPSTPAPPQGVAVLQLPAEPSLAV